MLDIFLSTFHHITKTSSTTTKIVVIVAATAVVGISVINFGRYVHKHELNDLGKAYCSAKIACLLNKIKLMCE